LNTQIGDRDSKIQTLEASKSELSSQVSQLNTQIVGLTDELSRQVSQLNAQIAGLSIGNNNPYPFIVPTTGTVGSQVSTYLSNYNGSIHYGIDIWTSTQNSGAISTQKGNPVYSVCDGIVESFQVDNGGVTISCNTIASSFNIPIKKVYSYYGHMANALTKEQYINIKIGQKVRKGQFIGYQGNLSMFTPGMRNVHLHFSIFTGPRERDGTLDPCIYIGGSCKEVGRFLVSEFK
jgi:murein DD-endopeptidase MepM/ murein hydrolase activator NlpD